MLHGLSEGAMDRFTASEVHAQLGGSLMGSPTDYHALSITKSYTKTCDLSITDFGVVKVSVLVRTDAIPDGRWSQDLFRACVFSVPPKAHWTLSSLGF